jgi:hypothetical protein
VRQNGSIPGCVAFERYTLATAVPLSPSLPAPLLRLRSDEQLLGQFRAGREDAFRILHERYHDRLLAYVRHMLHGHADAEDVVQDVFERARTGLAEAAEARYMGCAAIREQLALAVDRRGRPPRLLRDHLRHVGARPRSRPGAAPRARQLGSDARGQPRGGGDA